MQNIEKKINYIVEITSSNQYQSEQLDCAQAITFSQTSLLLDPFFRQFWIVLSISHHKPEARK